jgi:hypothetical protein
MAVNECWGVGGAYSSADFLSDAKCVGAAATLGLFLYSPSGLAALLIGGAGGALGSSCLATAR